MIVFSSTQFMLRNRRSFVFGPMVSILFTAFVGISTSGKDSNDNGLLATDGLSVASWEEAGQLVGQSALVYGKIVDIGHAKGISFINFATGQRDSFCAVIFERSDEAFGKPYEELYLGKNVTIRGNVTVFKGAPQIVIGKPDQITVVDTLPESNIIAPNSVKVGNELIVGSYNIKNLFDAEDDPYHNDEGTNPKPREEMVRVAKVMHEINADVLALQEVESRGYLQKFVDAMLGDMGYEHVIHFEGNDGRGIDVCLISRIPIGEVTSHRHHVFEGHDGKPQRFGRDLLRVELLPKDGEPFEMWVVHLKSNSGGKELNEPIRLGECREVHRIIQRRLKQNPDVSLILCGDFNDTFETKTLQTILGETPTLKTIFDEIPQDQRITYNRDPYRSMIDFMLCSPAMVKRLVPGSFVIRQGTDEDSGSDHNPIVAKFQKNTTKSGATVPKAVSKPASPAIPSAYADEPSAPLRDEVHVPPVEDKTASGGRLKVAGMSIFGLAVASFVAIVAMKFIKSQ